MKITDPGWFYSSLAQVSATIVALVGAFFGARLFEHLSNAARAHEHANAPIYPLATTIAGRMQHFPAFERFLTAVIPEDEKDLAAGVTRREQTDYVDWESARKGVGYIDPVRQHLAQAKQDLAVLPDVRAAYTPLSGEIRGTELLEYATRLRELARTMPGADNDQPKKLLRSDADTFYDLAERISTFCAGLLPGSFWVIFAVLLIVGVGGIILPLAALPGISDPAIHESSTVLLWSFIAGLALFLGYFGLTLWRLSRLRYFKWPT